MQSTKGISSLWNEQALQADFNTAFLPLWGKTLLKLNDANVNTMPWTLHLCQWIIMFGAGWIIFSLVSSHCNYYLKKKDGQVLLNRILWLSSLALWLPLCLWKRRGYSRQAFLKLGVQGHLAAQGLQTEGQADYSSACDSFRRPGEGRPSKRMWILPAFRDSKEDQEPLVLLASDPLPPNDACFEGDRAEPC